MLIIESRWWKLLDKKKGGLLSTRLTEHAHENYFLWKGQKKLKGQASNGKNPVIKGRILVVILLFVIITWQYRPPSVPKIFVSMHVSSLTWTHMRSYKWLHNLLPHKPGIRHLIRINELLTDSFANHKVTYIFWFQITNVLPFFTDTYFDINYMGRAHVVSIYATLVVMLVQVLRLVFIHQDGHIPHI